MRTNYFFINIYVIIFQILLRRTIRKIDKEIKSKKIMNKIRFFEGLKIKNDF